MKVAETADQIKRQRITVQRFKLNEACAAELDSLIVEFYIYLKKLAQCSFVAVVESTVGREDKQKTIMYVNRQGRQPYDY